jgi:transposase-like protein
MPTPKITSDQVAQAMRRYLPLKEQGLNVSQAADQMGMNRSTLQARIRQFTAEGGAVARSQEAELDIPSPPSADEPIEELLARRKLQYARSTASEEFHKLIPIKVKTAGPVAICAVGDPHVDDDKCDLGAIENDMTIIGQTEGMYALHVGDITNNWVGRLGRLYAHQTTKASDGIRIAEWMFGLAQPLAVVGGNHDLWNEGMSWLNFCVKQAGTKLLQEHGVRVELKFPGGKSLRIHTRHDFPGHSQFNSLHGLRKEHLFGLRDHVNIAGHKHIDAYAVIPSPDGYMQHMLRVSGYKGHDDYAKALNLQPMKMAPTCALIIDPNSKNEAEVVKPFWDMEEAADFLTFKRKRARL